MKLGKLLKIFYPLLALVLVLLVLEISFVVFDNYGLVVPYKDYFYNKRMPVSTLKGNPWTKLEFTNTVYRDRNFQHVPKIDFNIPGQKYIFLLGDSMVESVSTPVEKTFYSLVDRAHDEFSIFPFHFAGCSLRALSHYLNRFPAFFRRGNQAFRPDLAVLQIRPMSYQGGNTTLFDPRIGKARDFLEKIKIEKPPVVQEKTKFLKNFKLDIKFSSAFKDKLFRDLVLGDSKIISFVAWKIFQWSRRVTAAAPNHESFFVDNDLEELYWQRFEKTVQFLKQSSSQNQIPVAIILVPSPEWFDRYQYTKSLNKQEQRYKDLFAKYDIPFHYAINEFVAEKNSTAKEVFFADNHPSEAGVKALSKSLDNFLKELKY